MHAQLLDGDLRVLDGVVEHPRRHDLVGESAAVKQMGDLERMQDERGAVGLALLAAVAGGGELERAPGQRQVVNEGREAHGAVCAASVSAASAA